MLADGALPLDRADALRAHMPSCAACGAALEDLARVDALLTESLATPPPAAPRLLRLAWAAAAAGLLLAWALFAPGPSDLDPPPIAELPAAPPAPPRVAMVEGEVAVRRAGAEAPRAAVPNQSLHSGELVVTLEGQRAKLELPDRGELYVNERTELRMPTADDPDVKLTRGELFARKRGGDSFAVRTPLGVAEIDGHARIRLGPEEVRVAMLDGRGRFRRPARTFDLSIGEELVVPRSDRRSVTSEPLADRRVPEWQRKLQAVEFLDAFPAEGLSPIWRAQPKEGAPWSIADGVLTLAAPAEGPKRRAASLLNLRPFEVDAPVAFEFLVRQPGPHPQGRSAIVLVGQSAPEQKVAIRYSIGATDETLEVVRAGGKVEKIWFERRLRADRGWITIRLVLDEREISLERNGVDRVRRAHGIESLPPLRLQLHSVTGAPAGEGFETEFARISVRRE
jgi:hypothetical protein